VADECKMLGGGRAWISEGQFHFKRGLLGGGRKNIEIPLNSITSETLHDPGAAAYVRQGVHSAVVINGPGGRPVAHIPNMLPLHAKQLHGFLQARLAQQA
jgi:hypothetical protein